MIWSIDGVEWNIPCTVQRSFDIEDTAASGTMLNGHKNHDVLGTYLSYNISLAVPVTMMNDYYAVLSKLIDAVGEHMFVLPYNASYITFTAKVENLSDTYLMGPGMNLWRGISFSVTANEPVSQH